MTNAVGRQDDNLGTTRTADGVSANSGGYLHLWRCGWRRQDSRTDPRTVAPCPQSAGLQRRILPAHHPQITNPGGLWDESLNFYPRFGGAPLHRAHGWRWERGGRIKFSHLQLNSTVYE